MAEAVTDKLVHNLKRCGLLESDQLESFLERKAVAIGTAAPPTPEELADQLVAEGLLTKWQAKKLLAGKYKGFLLGKYKLLGEVGRGGMSAVYLAEHILMRRQVAIKVLPKQRVKDSSYLERFQLEARAVAKLDDPHIVRAYDIDNEGDTHYIVMEYVDGIDLHRLVAQHGPLKPEMAADYIAQAATGLAHAHEKELVHRDIKPANLLVDRTQTVKLLDLGLAKLNGDEPTSLTLANEENVLGTADYLAPEQAVNSHQVDHRSDIYSLGCTLFFLLTGKPPFPEGTIAERLLKHQREQPPSILQLRPDAPISLVEICMRMMHKKRELRYQTAMEVVEVLTKWLADRGRTVRGGRTETDSLGEGAGSDILRRFAFPSPSSIVGGPLDSSNLDSNVTGFQDTARLSGSTGGGTLADEDFSLAPLEDDEAPAKKPSANGPVADQRAAASHVLAGELSGIGKTASAKGSRLSSKSLIEEELAVEQEARPHRSANQSGYNPLHPPGYTSPYQRKPWGLILGIGAGAAALLGVLIALLG